jgi:hypothetical protein
MPSNLLRPTAFVAALQRDMYAALIYLARVCRALLRIDFRCHPFQYTMFSLKHLVLTKIVMLW